MTDRDHGPMSDLRLFADLDGDDPDETPAAATTVEPWIVARERALIARKETLLYLVVSADDAVALSEGVVPQEVREQAHELLLADPPLTPRRLPLGTTTPQGVIWAYGYIAGTWKYYLGSDQGPGAWKDAALVEREMR